MITSLSQFETLSRSDRVYLDHNATAPLAKFLLPKIQDWLLDWGNPSSIHWSGRGPKALLRESRKAICAFLEIHPLELVFTSGASESNNTLVKGLFDYFLKPRPAGKNLEHLKVRDTFIFSNVEHPSIMKTALYLRERGAVVHFVPVSREGVFDFVFFESLLSDRVALVSVMLANNETGHIFPIKKIAEAAHSVGALVHTDGVQALGKMKFSLKDLEVDYASFSGHKFYALKGVGLLYIKRGSPYVSLIDGGSQERSRRGGTENVLAIASLAEMVRNAPALAQKLEEIQKLRDDLEDRLEKELPGIEITGKSGKRLGNTSSLIMKGVDGESLLMNLDMKGFAVSTGAACSSGSPEPSPVLLAMGLTREEAQGSLRVGLGYGNTSEQINSFIENLILVVQHLRSVSLPQERRVNESNESST